jgi:hypothetical protein
VCCCCSCCKNWEKAWVRKLRDERKWQRHEKRETIPNTQVSESFQKLSRQILVVVGWWPSVSRTFFLYSLGYGSVSVCMQEATLCEFFCLLRWWSNY